MGAEPQCASALAKRSAEGRGGEGQAETRASLSGPMLHTTPHPGWLGGPSREATCLATAVRTQARAGLPEKPRAPRYSLYGKRTWPIRMTRIAAAMIRIVAPIASIFSQPIVFESRMMYRARATMAM